MCIKANTPAGFLLSPVLASSELDSILWLANTGLRKKGMPGAGKALGKKAKLHAISGLSYFASEFRCLSFPSDMMAAGSS